MIKFLKSIILFALIFFIVDKFSYLILLKQASLQSEQKLDKIVNGNLQYELLVLGSSRGAGNISTRQLQSETGLTSYNLSYWAGDLIFQEYIFRTYLENNKKPNVLLLGIDSPTMFSVGGSLKFRFDRLYPLAYKNSINDKLIAMGKHPWLSKYIYSLRLHNFQLKFNKIETNFGLEIDENGSQVLNGQAPSFIKYEQDEKPSAYEPIESQEKIDALKNIIKVCQDRNIELHFIFPPNLIPFNTAFYNRFVNEFGKQNQIFVYDRNNTVYKTKTIYFDPIHLHAEGAKIFTSELSKYINSQ